MKYIFIENIAHDENLRQTLLAQEGGIMKFIAEHLDAKSFAQLFSDYQNQCAEKFIEANSWNPYKVWSEDELRRIGLGENEHLRKELHYLLALKPSLASLPEDVSETVYQITKLYMNYAYEQHRHRWHPEGLSDIEVYNEVTGLFATGGLAYKCMKLILREHHADGEVEKTESDYWVELVIRLWSAHFPIASLKKIRNVVAEMLVGETSDQCIRKASDTLEKFRSFSQMIYTDRVVQALRKIKYTTEADKREKDGEWLRDVAQNAMLEEFSDNVKIHSLRYYFANFVNILNEIGCVWAAQLLVRGIDMKKLEQETSCILNPEKDPHYYIDKFFLEDLPNQYCIADIRQAKRLLQKMGYTSTKDTYLEVAVEGLEEDVKNKLSKAYIILKDEGFLRDSSTKQTTFIDVFINNTNRKIVWLEDPQKKFLKTLISIFLGKNKDYPYPPILKVSERGSYVAFVQNHFVDNLNNPIEFDSRMHNVGRKDIKQLELILKATYGEIIKPKPKHK